MLSPALLSLLQPDLALAGSVLKLTPALLDQYGLQGLILDVDDTIVSSKSKEVPPELFQWLVDIKQVAQVALVSNNLNRARISRIANLLDLPYEFGAGKPSRRKLRPVVDAMGLPCEQVAMVGDRLFTDVLAGNRLGMFTIWVEPLTHASLLRAVELRIFHILGASLRNVIH
jgi:hypothetical protein